MNPFKRHEGPKLLIYDKGKSIRILDSNDKTISIIHVDHIFMEDNCAYCPIQNMVEELDNYINED